MAGKKKELKIYNEWNDSLFRLKFIGGGQIPDSLDGRFTSVKEAEKIRDLYYLGKLPKSPQGIRSQEEAKIEAANK